MPLFHYDANDADGQPVSGETEAEDAKQLAARLDEMGLSVQSIHEIRQDDADSANGGQAPVTAEVVEPEVIEPAGRREGLSASDLHQLSEQLADLTQAGLPLAPGLKAFAQELPSGRLRRSALRMVRQLERGDDLESVLASQHVPSDLLALLRAGARTGNTGQVLGQYVSHARQFVEIRRRGALLLGYPFILLTVSIVLFLAFLVLVVPGFKLIFSDFGISLPSATRFLIFMSDNATEYGAWVLVIAVCVLTAGWGAFRFGMSESFRRQLVYAIPLAGKILRYADMARFSHLLALMVEDEVPLPEALRLAAGSVSDVQLHHAANSLADRVAAGDSSADAAAELTYFPSTFVQAIRWEKHAGTIPALLRALAEMFESRSRDQATIIAAICGPLIVVFTGGLLGYLVIGLMLPLVTLVEHLT